MIFHFHAKHVTFFDEDKDYFEKRLNTILKYLGNEAGDEDSVEVTTQIEKTKHHSGEERFHAKAHMTCPHHGDFHAEVYGENIKQLADLLEDSLAKQARKFHEKHKR